jgi:hypothetical protein
LLEPEAAMNTDAVVIGLAVALAATVMPQEAPQTSTQTLRVHVVVPARAAVGAPIPIKLVVSNAGNTTIRVAQIGTPPDYDLAIARGDGRIVWERLPEDHISFLDGLHYTLAPSESRELEAIAWDQRDQHGHQVEPGRYTVRGFFYGGIAGSGHGIDRPTRTPVVQLVIGH